MRNKNHKPFYKVGYVSWFDDPSGEGQIHCPTDNKSYYVHYSAIKGIEGCKTLTKFSPVKFSLYENLYMKQVDYCEELSYSYSTEEMQLIEQLCNDAFESGDGNIFKIAEKYYVK